jgi:hypothetical protein
LKIGKVTSYIESLEGNEVKQYNYESDTHVIAIFDNQSNIDTEDGSSNEQESILKFVKEYCRLKLCNFFQWTCVLVFQKDFESEKINHNKNGEMMISRLEGSMSDIGDSKRSSRSTHLIFSLFAPSRYDLIRYPIPPKDKPQMAYNIEILGNRFRSLRVIKSNYSDVGMRLPLLFNGITEEFSELPPPDSNEMKEIYNKIGGNKFVKQEQKNIIQFDEEPPF